MFLFSKYLSEISSEKEVNVHGRLCLSCLLFSLYMYIYNYIYYIYYDKKHIPFIFGYVIIVYTHSSMLYPIMILESFVAMFVVFSIISIPQLTCTPCIY